MSSDDIKPTAPPLPALHAPVPGESAAIQELTAALGYALRSHLGNRLAPVTERDKRVSEMPPGDTMGELVDLHGKPLNQAMVRNPMLDYPHNLRCWCGRSNKKFKNCCLPKMQKMVPVQDCKVADKYMEYVRETLGASKERTPTIKNSRRKARCLRCRRTIA